MCPDISARAGRIAVLRRRLVPASTAATRLQTCIDGRTPAAAIRLGDGEGVLLSGRAGRDQACYDYCVSHFGPAATPADLKQLRDTLQEAVASADVIGIRPDMVSGVLPSRDHDLPDDQFLEAFRGIFALRPAEHRLIDSTGARRLGLLHDFFCRQELPPAAVITSAWCHFAWSASGLLARWMGSAARIGLITNRPALAELLRSHGKQVDLYRVPDKFCDRRPGWTPHFPNRYARLRDELDVRYRGQVFLVGAGICGKAYCHWIKQRGGIGIDVGSVYDAWLGLASRRLVMESMFGSKSVPPQLLLASQLSTEQ